MNSAHLPSHPSLHPELSALAIELNTWRAQRPSRRTPVPDALRRKAVNLLDRCGRSRIINVLGINSAMLKTWQSQNWSSAGQPEFVPLNVATISEGAQSPSLNLTLSNRTGQKVMLQGDFSAAQLALIAQALSGSALEPAQ